TSSLYLEIVDYPGEWLLDLPMLEQDYFEWSEQINKVNSQRTSPEQNWQLLLKKCDPFAPADETLLADIASAYTDYLLACKKEGLH
ncbi:YcjX family protein, partial [Escherichia coli]|nr:YcjX family protein [Escherichia coli]